MRQNLRLLALLCLLVGLLPAAAVQPAMAQPEDTDGDELVIINRDARILVVDPYTAPGYVTLSWESPQTGFGQVATGDFDGDGFAEIVGLRGGEAVIFDPFRQAGDPDVTRTFTASSGQVWQRAVAGRYSSGNRDGLVLVQSLNQGNLKARMIAYSYDPATGWTQNFTQDLGAAFQGLAAGDVDGDGRDELTGIRSPTGFAQILIFEPSANWNTIFEGNFSYPWVSLAVGNVQQDSGNRAEIVTTRTNVGTNLNSFLVFRYVGSSTLQDVAGEKFFPNFQWTALGDVNGDGDDEVYLLRPGIANDQPVVALTSRNLGGAGVYELNQLAGQTKFGNIQSGDVDGDGRAEVIVMSSDEYIIYTEPGSSDADQRFPGSYSTGLSFAVANLGDIPQGPRLSVSPTSVPLTLQSGQTATRAVQISNVGTGTINWTSSVTQGASWLSLQPTSGTAPTSATLNIDARNLAAGTYTGTVRISGQSGVGNSPVDVTVTLTVTAPPAPQLSVTPTQITLTLESGQSATRQIQIANTGAGAINWTASLVQGAPWLSFSPSSGTAPSTLTASINATDVLPGQYTGRIRIAGGAGVLNSPQDVTISLTVTAPPFFVSPTAVTWTFIPPNPPGTRTVTVTGTGISWHAGVVPMDSMARVQAAIDAGRQLAIHDGLLVLGDGGEDVPIVDYIDVSPSSSSANQTGVTLSLLADRVPYGLSQAAVVFVADQVASPPAVVVRTSVLRTLPGATDLLFMPYVP